MMNRILQVLVPCSPTAFIVSFTRGVQLHKLASKVKKEKTKAIPVTGPPLLSSGQNSCLQIQRPGFDSRRYQIFWEVVGLERSPLSLVSTTEVLFEIKNSGSGLENRDYGRRDSSRWQRGTLYPQQLTLTSLTSGGHSVGIVRSRTPWRPIGLWDVEDPTLSRQLAHRWR
jgi:hypothetical protein